MGSKKISLKPPSFIDHLLIDLDGTLLGAYDLPLRIEFTAKALSEMRKYGPWLKSFRALRSMYQELEKPSLGLTNEERSAKVFSKSMGISIQESQRILTQAIEILFPKMERYFYPMDGAIEFLNWAKSRYPMILATNPVWTEEIVKLRMGWAKIDPTLFRSITHSGRMHACKPSKEYYEEILKQENLTSSESFLIGNDVRKDLPATLVGIPVFILSNACRKLEVLKFKGQKAPAWKGTFSHLKMFLMETPSKNVPFQTP